MRLKSLAALALALALAPLPAAAQTARFDWFEYKGSNPVDAAHKLGRNEYRNPILGGFYPDPSVTRVGDDFYLVTSTFDWYPGIPVFHSKDLVNWTQIGNAIDRPEMLDFKSTGLSRGVFAPTIQAKDGMFYILNTCVDCGGNFVITAKDPSGPWSAPVWLPTLEGGIDPSLFFDDDGRSWIVNNGPPEGTPLYDGHRAIWVQEFNLRSLQAVGPRTLVVNGGVDLSKKPVWIEGPHILKKDGWYYLICAEGGTSVNHSQVALRSKSVTGPFVPWEGNPILTQRDLDPGRKFPITSAGHAQLVTTPDGNWWATFLATRPYEGDHYNTGRETFLLPVTWADGWPTILPPGKPIPVTHRRPDLPRGAKPPVPMAGPFTVRDTFDGPDLPLNWMMMRQPRERWYAFEDGALALTARTVGLDAKGNPSFAGRRQQHQDFTATTELRFEPQRDGDRAGLVALQGDDHWAFIGVGQDHGRPAIFFESKAGDQAQRQSWPIATANKPVRLRITGNGKTYSFAWSADGKRWEVRGTVPAKAFSTNTAGGFVGTVIGPYARKGD